jgi:23S rRNA (adenine2503-C2)-methyltransferase
MRGKIKNLSLSSQSILDSVELVYDDLNLDNNKKVLLISYMGCGEPVLNYANVVDSMIQIRNHFRDLPLVRFAVATSLPKNYWFNFFKLVSLIEENDLKVKIHLSLHYTMDNIRKQWMPNSLDILPSLVALEYFKKLTNNSVEIHYTLIDGVNDTEQDAILLSELLKNRGIPVKFLFYNEKPSIDFHASSKQKLDIFRKYFEPYNIESEYYIPPGLDVGASCGQFLLDYYLKYNKIKGYYK